MDANGLKKLLQVEKIDCYGCNDSRPVSRLGHLVCELVRQKRHTQKRGAGVNELFANWLKESEEMSSKIRPAAYEEKRFKDFSAQNHAGRRFETIAESGCSRLDGDARGGIRKSAEVVAERGSAVG